MERLKITDADGIDWPPISPLHARPGSSPHSPQALTGHPFVPEDMRPAWTGQTKLACGEVLAIGDQLVRCELTLEGRHTAGGEHHGHLEMPGKIWATVTWRANGTR